MEIPGRNLALSPDPEITPVVAGVRGAAFAAHGRSVHNVHATRFTDEMLLAASRALAELTGPDALVPNPLDRPVHHAVAAAAATGERAARPARPPSAPGARSRTSRRARRLAPW